MKKLLFLLLLPAFSFAGTYYVSPTGADSNPGSILQPFKTLTRASVVLAALPSHGAGDIVYVRNGTYNGWPNNPANGYAQMLMNNIHGTAGAWCTIMNYPGEVPIFDFTGVVVQAARPSPTGLSVFNSTYLIIKGIRLTGYNQITTGLGVSRGFELNNVQHMIIENCTVDHFQGTGFFISGGSSDITYLNCDSHHNEDPLSATPPAGPGSDAWDNADGFGITGVGNNTTTVTFNGCRAWLNCDDGWDNFGADGSRLWVNCWAFLNGYYQRPGMPTPLPAGNGQGFKLGPMSDGSFINTNNLRILNNCIAFNNRAHGFDQNGENTTRMTLYNCTAYGNGGYGFQFQYYPVSPGTIGHTIKNNAALSNGSGNVNLASAIPSGVTNNSWQNGLTINSSDFVTLDTAGVSGPRNEAGDLPTLNFLHLVSGSDLRNAGTPVGIPYCDSNPDLGAYEYCAAPDVPPTAYAGADKLITQPVSTVALSDATASGVPTLAYFWSALDGGGFSSTTVLNPTVNSLSSVGVYRFVLRVTDGNSVVVRDTVQVQVVAPTTQIVPTGALIRSVTVNRLNNSTLDFTATISNNSQSFNVQRKAAARGATYKLLENIPVSGTAYVQKYSTLRAGDYVRVCPVDKQGVPPCSAAVVVKKK